MKNRYNVLFLCTGNSARSIVGEAIMNKKGFPNFTAHSAGSHPKGEVHPLALQQIEIAKLPTSGLRSKDWNEFAKPGASQMDFVFTVCDNAAKEVCPVWHESISKCSFNLLRCAFGRCDSRAPD